MANYLAPDAATGIPKSTSGTATSAGGADAGKIVQLNGSGLLDSTMFGAVARASKLLTAGESLSAGDRVYVASAGEVRKSDATNITKLCTGYVEDTAAAAASVKVYEDGIQTGLSGLTEGARYFASATPGAITTTPPTTAGHTVQSVGTAYSETELSFKPEIMWTN